MRKRCAYCGAAFSVGNSNNRRYCSAKCQKRAGYARAKASGRIRGFAISATEPVPLITLTTARKKPKNTSAVRWRMELARRADPMRYALAACAGFRNNQG